MSQIEVTQIIEQIKEEITVESNGQSRASIRATARLAGVDNQSIRKALESLNVEPSKLAQKIRLQGINIDSWHTNGIPHEGVYLIVEYYAFEAGRYCNHKARQAITYFNKHKTFDGFIYSEVDSGLPSPEKRVKASVLRKIGNMSNPVIEVNTPVGKIDILTDKEIIEVKRVSGWKSAVGQILVYGYYYPNHQKRIHLFGKCSPNIKQLIHLHCEKLNIQVTWQ